MTQILSAIIAALGGLPILKQLIDVVNGSLDLTKKVREDLFHDGEKALQQPDSDEHAVERTRAAADLLRSYALFGFSRISVMAGQSPRPPQRPLPVVQAHGPLPAPAASPGLASAQHLYSRFAQIWL